MDIFRLGPVYSTDYLPDYPVEGYSSAIWTERFVETGEFEIKTPYVSETMALLPEDTLISHRDTDEVMIVETHLITLDGEGNEELTVSGRSLTSFLEHRFIEAAYKKKRTMRRNYSPSGAVSVLLWQAFVNASGKDVTRGDNNAETPELNDYAWTTLDRILNVSITNSVSAVPPARRWWLTEGMLLPQLQTILTQGDIGVRAIRPSSRSAGKIVTVASMPLADRGTITQAYTENISSLRFDIYDGINRAQNQATNPKVSFSVPQGDVDKVQYLFSKKEFKTMVEAISSVGISDTYRNATEQAYSGLRRRTMQMDAGDPDIPPEPQKPPELRKNATKAQRDARADAMDVWIDKHAAWVNKRNAIIADFKADFKEDALAQLKKVRRITMLSGDVSPYAQYKYRMHYNLGDTVTLSGDYGLSENMIVSEYIRTEDAEGDRGYPGLTLP